MAATLQIASGGRLILGMGIGGAPKEHAAYGIDVPRGEGAGAPPRGGDRRHPGAVDRWSGDAALAAVSARGRPAFPVPTPPPPIIIGGETRDGARLAGRIGDGWSAFEDNFEQNLPLYLEALEASGRRRESSASSSGSRGRVARRRRHRRDPLVPGSARELGSDGAGPAPTGRSSSPGRPPTSTRSSRPPIAGRRPFGGSCHHRVRWPPTPRPTRRRAGGANPCLCALRRSPPRRSSACARSATRSGCATRPARRSTGRCSWRRLAVVVPRGLRSARGDGVGPFPAEVGGVVRPTEGLTRVAQGDELRDHDGLDDVPRSPMRRRGQASGRFVQSPRIEPGDDALVHAS